MPVTMPTAEPLTIPVRRPFDGVNVQTLVAGLAGVGRIDPHNLYSSAQSFVVNKQSQLVERPTIRPSTLSFFAGLLIRAFTDARQVFQRNAGLFELGGLNKTFRDVVIQPGLKSTLKTRQPLQQFTHSTACTACALTGFVLELRSQAGIVVTHFVDALSFPGLSIGSMSNVSASQIYAQNILACLRLWRLGLQTNLEIIGTILSLNQRGRFGVRAFERPDLVVANCQFKPLTTLNRGQRNRPVFLPKREDSSVVGDKANLERFHWTVLLFGNFTRACNPPANLLSQITRQTKTSANLVIAKRLQLYRIGYLLWRVLVDPVQRLPKSVKRRIQFLGLRLINLELAGDSQGLIHSPILSHQKEVVSMPDRLSSGSVSAPDSHSSRRSLLVERGAPAALADKWATAIIYVLSQGAKRYGELQRGVGDVSQRMLTRTLRNLERDGLIRREVYPTKPTTVEYSLTSLGKTLVEPLQLLCRWSIDHFHEVETARKREDR
jgi:DNA-binding HxlR family transcriptional regulator